jgi:GMP synthase (glutamine-hydrolysing)
MRVLSVVHEADAAAGVFGEAAGARGDEIIEWMPPSGGPPPDRFDAVMVFGGSMNVDQEDRHPWLVREKRFLRTVLDDGTPVFGVCLGAQLLAEAADAAPRRAATPEIGWYEIELTPSASADPLFGGLPDRFLGFQWHGYEFPLPTGAVPLARNSACLQAFHAGSVAWGIQFHAEVQGDAVAAWIESPRPEEDGDLDIERLEAETKEKIGRWNELGKLLAGRFLDVASAPR